MRVLLAFLALLFLVGCSSGPIHFEAKPEIISVQGFRKSPKNAYAILMKGQGYEPPHAPMLTPANLATGKKLVDPFVDNDLEALAELSAQKGFDVYKPELPVELYDLLGSIALASDEQTRVAFFYSGEGNSKGLRAKFCQLDGRIVTCDDFTITPKDLLSAFGAVRGSQALVINACESGCFVDEAQHLGFKGTVIAACGVGFATTPCETKNHSALFTSFLGEYEDDPATIKNLATMNLSRVGQFTTNYRHKWVDFWSGGGLPISYASVHYSTSDFLF